MDIKGIWKGHIAWRFSRCKYLLVYWRYLKNYREVLECREKEVPVQLKFRCGINLEFSNAASSLHIFDEIFVAEVYKLSKSNQTRTIVDIGANVGLFSVYALLKIPRANIYAVEADPFVFQELAKNLRANELTNKIKIFHQAMASKPGKIVLYAAKHFGWSSIFNDQGAKSGRPVEVDAANLTLFCKEHHLEKIDYLKVDIEGAEYDFILGDRDFFRNEIEEMAVEVDRDPRDKRYFYDDLIRVLKQNYRLVRVGSLPSEYPLLYCSGRKK